MAEASGITVIGVGNDYRGDDAIGLTAARKLKERVGPNIKVLEHDGDGAGLVECWKNSERVIVMDAVHSDAEPGSVFRFDVAAWSAPERFFSHSTHAFGVAQAVELARALNQLPQALIIYGVEGKNYDAGATLSAEARQGIDQIVEQSFSEIQSWIEG